MPESFSEYLAEDLMQTEREVVFLEQPRVRFVSLVRRGANRMPFRVVKSESGAPVRKLIQAVIAPSSMEAAEVRKAFAGNVSALRFDRPLHRGAFTVYEQLPREACKADSFELLTLGQGGEASGPVRAVQAELPERGHSGGLLSRLFKAEPEADAAPEVVPDPILSDLDAVAACGAEAAAALERFSLAVVAVLAEDAPAEVKLARLRKLADACTGSLGELLAVCGGAPLRLEPLEPLEAASETGETAEPAPTPESDQAAKAAVLPLLHDRDPDPRPSRMHAQAAQGADIFRGAMFDWR